MGHLLFQCVVRCSEQGSLCHIITCIAVSRGRSGKRGSNHLLGAICIANEQNLLKKKGGGGGGGSGPPGHPLDLPLVFIVFLHGQL